MEGVRVRSEAGRSQSASAVYRAISTANRLANLVRGHGVTRRLPVDIPFCLETFAQRSGYIVTPGQQSLSRQTAALHSRTPLSVSVRAAERRSLVEARADQRMAAGALSGQSALARHHGREALARLR